MRTGEDSKVARSLFPFLSKTLGTSTLCLRQSTSVQTSAESFSEIGLAAVSLLFTRMPELTTSSFLLAELNRVLRRDLSDETGRLDRARVSSFLDRFPDIPNLEVLPSSTETSAELAHA